MAPERHRAWRALRESDSGFSMIESLVAVVLAVIIFMVLTATVAVWAKASRQNRFEYQATSLAMDQIESLRTLTWTELAMSSVNESAPMLNATKDAMDPDEADLESEESLYVDAVNGLVAPRYEETIDGLKFEVWQYVSTPDTNLRRIIVFVVWPEEGNRRTTRMSTVMSEVTAGG